MGDLESKGSRLKTILLQTIYEIKEGLYRVRPAFLFFSLVAQPQVKAGCR